MHHFQNLNSDRYYSNISKHVKFLVGVWDLENLQLGKTLITILWQNHHSWTLKLLFSEKPQCLHGTICRNALVQKFWKILQNDFTSCKQILMSNVFVEVAWFITKCCALSGLSLSQPFLPRTRKAKLYNLGNLFFPFTLIVNESKSLNQMTLLPEILLKLDFFSIKKFYHVVGIWLHTYVVGEKIRIHNIFESIP